MKIYYKTPEELAAMKDGGAILKAAAEHVLTFAKPGVTTLELDRIAEEFIISSGGESSFKTVKGYHWTTCTPVNEQVVHTPPSLYKLKKGDKLTLDIGNLYKGWHTDYAYTVWIGEPEPPHIKKFFDTGKEAVEKAISVAKTGAYLGEISYMLQSTIEGAGYKILKDLTGHGIGRVNHEEPYVLCYVDKPIEKTLQLKTGLTIAIEVMYSMGTEEIAYEDDEEWSIISADRSMTATFEKTVAISENGAILLT